MRHSGPTSHKVVGLLSNISFTAQHLFFFFVRSVEILTFHDVVCFSFWAVDDQGSASSTLTVVIVKCYGCSNHGVCDFDHPRPTSEPNQLRSPCLCDIGWEGTTAAWLFNTTTMIEH